MNIFYLDHNTRTCARYHNDKHVVKMILESCQLLSTAHRLLDGTANTIQLLNKNNKLVNKIVYVLPSKRRDELFYQATHINHPSAKWARENRANYHWLACLTTELCHEYTRRYGKVHKCYQTGLVSELQSYPENLVDGEFCQPPQAMPDEFKVDNDSISAYRTYYARGKSHIARWKGTLLDNDEIPSWLEQFS